MPDKETLDKILAQVVPITNPEKVILFGSHAWGNPRENSDIDLCIVKDTDQTGAELRRERARVQELFYGQDLPPIDMINYTPKRIQERTQKGDFFARDILEKGKVIYES